MGQKEQVFDQRARYEVSDKRFGVNKIQSGQSYAEVVKESMCRLSHPVQLEEEKQKDELPRLGKMIVNQKDNQKIETMNWEDNSCDSSWLGLSVVDVLKSFTDISSII